MELLDSIFLHNHDCLKGIKDIPDGSIDVILTDPPYLYLKNQKLERVFDEVALFTEWKRVLKKGGFVVLFGRGTSFYRWNTILAELGFDFKEEIVWNKSHGSSPLMPLTRVHETVSIHCKGKGSINKVKVPYLEMKQHDIGSIIQDIKRMRAVFNNTKSLDAVLNYLESNQIEYDTQNRNKHKLRGDCNDADRCSRTFNSIVKGMNEKSIIRSDRHDTDTFSKHNITTDKRQRGDRCVDVINGVTQGMNEKSIIKTHEISTTISSRVNQIDRAVIEVNKIAVGMNEKSIIKQVREHYTSIHPTQKPVRLLERLLALVSKPGDTMLDCFAGSFSGAEACINMQLKGIFYEIDEEYYKNGVQRLKAFINKKEIA